MVTVSLTILPFLLGFGITAPTVPGQYYHAPDSWASEVSIEDGRIKNSLPLDMTVQPNKPTGYNLKRLRVPYTRYSGIAELEGTKPVELPADKSVPILEKVPESASTPETTSEISDQTKDPHNEPWPVDYVEDPIKIADVADGNTVVPSYEDHQVLETGYKELLWQAAMGRLDERSGKGRPRGDVLNDPIDRRQFDMRDYAQRMMSNVVRERNAMLGSLQ